MALRPDMASTHVLRVQRLYRQGLKCLMNWTVHRELWIHEGNLLRKEFEANRHQDNPRLIEKIISRGEAKLKAHVHPAPYISASFLPRPYHPLPAAPPLHKRGGGAHLPLPPPPPPLPLTTRWHTTRPPASLHCSLSTARPGSSDGLWRLQIHALCKQRRWTQSLGEKTALDALLFWMPVLATHPLNRPDGSH